MNTTTDGSDYQWELVEELSTQLPLDYVNLAVFVIFLFEYLITIDCEVRLAWSRKLSCEVIIFMGQAFTAILYAVWAVVIIIRGCWIASETIVIAVTCLKIRNKALFSLWTSSSTSFTELVLGQGILYFVVLLCLNAVQIVFAFYEDTFSLIILFTDPLTAILISHFYFALDDLQAQQTTTMLPSARHTTLQFAASKNTDGTHSGGSCNDDYIIYDAQIRDGLPPPVPPKDVYN
ncbi:hypothetical protein VTO73DRAFT_2915 [Trametes versicolor]